MARWIDSIAASLVPILPRSILRLWSRWRQRSASSCRAQPISSRASRIASAG